MNEQQTAVPAQQAPRIIPLPTLNGVSINSSRRILSKDSKLCLLVWAPSGYGKTKLAGSLDALTQKYDGKRTLFVTVEEGEGGGAATLRNLDVPIVVPKDYNDAYRIMGLIRNDKSIGGVAFDSGSEFAKKHVKNAALKYPARENVATRQAGIPTRSDYQTMGELMSQVLRMLISYTTHEDPAYRKHVIVTAADMTREEDEKVVYVGPDLPGRMGREAVQMFQQAGTIGIKPQLVDGKRVLQRSLTFQGDGVKALKDRFDILPAEMQLRASPDQPGEDLLTMWEKYYIPNMVQ